MPTIKIYPPAQLPDRTLTETQFSIWKEELEVYLSQEKSFKIFLPNGSYHNWESAETYNNRVRRLNENDRTRISNNVNVERANTLDEEKLADIQTNLRTLLSIVGKCVSEGHYNSVVRHSTSLSWIYDMIRSDYDIQSKGIHFFNVIDIKYDPDKFTAVSFYNSYRTIIVNNLAKNGDIIKYKNDEVLNIDEKMTPMLEDIVLLNVIREIDERLPAFVRNHYNQKMKAEDCLMDFKTDMLINIPKFLEEIENSEHIYNAKEASLHALKRFPAKKYKKTPTQPQLYCRMCWLAKMPKDIYLSHDIGDEKCSQLSYQDKLKLKEAFKLNMIGDLYAEENSDEDIAASFGYSCSTDNPNNEEVKCSNKGEFNKTSHRISMPSLTFIKPIASQILTVFREQNNKIPIHIELDSGASINFCEEDIVLKLGFNITYNKQISKLGDGETKIESIGEITETFYRNNWTVLYRAAVCKKLSSPFIGGTVFMKDNGIEQDFANDIIKLHNKTHTVQPTDPLSLLPIAPFIRNKQVKNNQNHKLLTFASQWLLPGQEATISLPDKLKENKLVAIESSELNDNHNWPPPSITEVKNGAIILTNETGNPINLGKEVKKCKAYDVIEPDPPDESYYCYEPQLLSLSNVTTDIFK